MAETANDRTGVSDGNTRGNGNGNLGGQNPPDNAPPPESDDNEISLAGKRLAGVLLILCTVFSGLYLVGHWPDQLVKPGEPVKPLYTYRWFNVRLVGIPDTGPLRYFNDSVLVAEASLGNFSRAKPDTTLISSSMSPAERDSIRRHNDSLHLAWVRADSVAKSQFLRKKFPPESSLMHVNTLLLILVALAGFLGNMIYVATSFTTFIGNRQYRRSWGLWYFVKPFTAAALALTIYFVFRGGFLNMSDDSTNINLYGLITISILAGLFTDRTTLKLKEVFDVLLRPKEERANPLAIANPELLSVVAAPLEAGKPVTIRIVGKNLDQKLAVRIEGQEVANVDTHTDSISFVYTLPDTLKDKESVTLDVLKQDGTAAWPPRQLPVKKETTMQNNTPAAAETADNTADTVQHEGDEAYNQREFGDQDSDDNDINKPQE